MNSPYAYQDTQKEATRQMDAAGLEVAPTPIPQPMPQWDYSQHHGQPGPAAAPAQTIGGLRRSTFFLAVALVIVVIAAAVGGGVGGSLAVQNAKQQCAASAATITVTAAATTPASGPPASRSGTGTATTSSRLAAPTRGVLALDCPALDDQGQQLITIGSQSWRFAPRCATDYQGNDIGGVIVYSFRDCLQACASHNQWVGRDECKAVRFNADMEAIIARFGGDCFLKNGTDVRLAATDLDVTAVLASSSLGTG